MCKILIIDDQESIIEMLKRRLGKYDYSFNSCLNVAEARQFLKTEKVDLLLIDYMMPETSGFDFFLSFKDKEDIPVIMMTAHPTINLVTEFIKHGGADFIEKPVDIDILHMKIQRAVRNHQKLTDEKNKRLKAEEDLKLSYECLKEKSQQLEVANSQLESFAGVVAHDLRSPLAGQSMIVKQLILRANAGTTNTDGDYLELLNLLNSTSTEMLLLVNALFEFSKLKKGCFNLQTVNTATIVKDIAAAYKGNQNLQFNIGELHEIEAEPVLIKQVFTNLIQNAIKYSATKDQQLVEIQSTITGQEITFSIRDNGIGFNMKNANEIFSMFSRLDTDEEFEGTGIGLAIVKNIIDRHNGKIWVESIPGEGTCFYFSIQADYSSYVPGFY